MKPDTPRFAWRRAYDTERDKLEAAACEIHCDDPSLTQQHFTEDADLNVIAKRFGLDNAPMPPAPADPRYYGDFSMAPDLRTIMDRVNDARNHFMALPAKLRARFNNDPDTLWSFVNDPDNTEEAVRLGLLKKPEPPPAATNTTQPAGAITAPENPPKTP